MNLAEAVRSIASGEPQKTEHSLQSNTRWEVRQSTVELSQADKGWTQLEVAAGLASLLSFLFSFLILPMVTQTKLTSTHPQKH